MKGLPGRLVLLGHPVSHSLSPTFQNVALRRAALPLRYEAIDVAPEALAATWSALRDERAAGNVTIPHKEAAARLCDRLTPLAERVGAVNTFWRDGGDVVGDNTDVGGFDASVRALLGEVPYGRRVALLGAGGAAAGVLAAVEGWAGASVTLWSRSEERAAALAARFAGVARAEASLTAAVRGADLVVNATPVGLRSDDVPLPAELLPREAAVVDLVYRRDGATPWVRLARECGLRAVDGLPMLVEQGALAFERWLGRAPDRAAMWASVTAEATRSGGGEDRASRSEGGAA